MQIGALYGWAATLVNDDSAEQLQHLTASLPATFGLVYTLALAFAYLPTTIIMKRRVMSVARLTADVETATQRETWLSDQGLLFPFSSGMGQLLAVLGPALVGGPVTSLVASLMGAGA